MSRQSPLRSVWFNPSRTIANIAHENPGYRLFALPILAGFAVWPTVALFSTGEGIVRSGLVFSTLLSFGPFIEVIQLLVGAYLIRLTGIWFGGNASIASIQAAIAWGNVPIVFLAIVSIILMVFSALYVEITDTPLTIGQSSLVTGIGIFFLAMQFVVVFWSAGIFLKGLAAVQGYSTSRAIVNSILAWTVPTMIIIIIAVFLGHSDKVPSLFFAGFEELILLGE